jgi:hypothetical protein
MASSDILVKENGNKNKIYFFVVQEIENKNDNYFENENRIRTKMILLNRIKIITKINL